jgi:ribosome-binding protein aMBF1 (putative translation factor)
MNIKIKIDGSKYVVCKDCGVYYKSQSGKKNKKICTRCTLKVAVI